MKTFPKTFACRYAPFPEVQDIILDEEYFQGLIGSDDYPQHFIDAIMALEVGGVWTCPMCATLDQPDYHTITRLT